MTFNHTQIAIDIITEADKYMVDQGWSNNAAMAYRMYVAHRFIKAQINYLQKEEGELWNGIIELYRKAMAHTIRFGQMIGQADEEALNDAATLTNVTVEMMIDKLEGGNAGDLDLTWREMSQRQLFLLYKQIKAAAGEEAAEIITEMHNAMITAVNLELEIANSIAVA
jgi:hypothetical protein